MILNLQNKPLFITENIFDIKFIYSEKATKFCEISTVDLTVTKHRTNLRWWFRKKFVSDSQNLNFSNKVPFFIFPTDNLEFGRPQKPHWGCNCEENYNVKNTRKIKKINSIIVRTLWGSRRSTQHQISATFSQDIASLFGSKQK